MKLETKKYLYDIARAAASAAQFVEGKTFADYSSDVMLRSAVERQLEIVGEALAQLARTDPITASKISEYQRIIAFRNILIDAGHECVASRTNGRLSACERPTSCR